MPSTAQIIRFRRRRQERVSSLSGGRLGWGCSTFLSLIVALAGVLAALGAWLRPDEFFRAYLMAFMAWLGVTLGSMAILMLRHLTKGWQDYRQFKHRLAVTHWKDLVRSSLSKHAEDRIVPLSKREEKDLQRQLVVELMERYPNDTHRQIAEWPHSTSLFYQRRKEVLANRRAA